MNTLKYWVVPFVFQINKLLLITIIKNATLQFFLFLFSTSRYKRRMLNFRVQRDVPCERRGKRERGELRLSSRPIRDEQIF